MNTFQVSSQSNYAGTYNVIGVTSESGILAGSLTALELVELRDALTKSIEEIKTGVKQ